MMMLECDAKRLLASAGVSVPRGMVWRQGDAAPAAGLPDYPVAVKAQVRSGGRGRQGGVLKVSNATELASAAKKLFATEFGGELPAALLIEPWLPIEREAYLFLRLAFVDGRDPPARSRAAEAHGAERERRHLES